MATSSAVELTSNSLLAHRLRALGVSQGELARRSGLSRQTISIAYRGEMASLATWVRIARALEVPVSDVSPTAAAELDGVAV